MSGYCPNPCEHEPEVRRRGGCVDCHHTDVGICPKHWPPVSESNVGYGGKAMSEMGWAFVWFVAICYVVRWMLRYLDGDVKW